MEREGETGDRPGKTVDCNSCRVIGSVVPLAASGYLTACVAKLQALQNIIAEYARVDAPIEQRSVALSPDKQAMAQSPDPQTSDASATPAPPEKKESANGSV